MRSSRARLARTMRSDWPNEEPHLNGADVRINRVALWFAGVAFSSWALVLGAVYYDFRESIDSGILPVAEERTRTLQRDIQKLDERLSRLEDKLIGD